MPPIDIEKILTDILNIFKVIFEMHPQGTLDPPENENQMNSNPRDLKTNFCLFELNASYIMVKYGNVIADNRMLAHVLSTIRHVRTRDPRCISLAI
jgi:hypothetical protein